MKEIILYVKDCGECPYHEYDPNYGMSYNSGYDCNLSGKRIADDVGTSYSDLTKIPIPDWCELKTVDEKVIYRKRKINKILNK